METKVSGDHYLLEQEAAIFFDWWNKQVSAVHAKYLLHNPHDGARKAIHLQ
jgi:hypothetical protein